MFYSPAPGPGPGPGPASRDYCEQHCSGCCALGPPDCTKCGDSCCTDDCKG